MAKTTHYYNSLPECSIVDYEVIPLPEAALLWCGVKFEDLAEEMKFITHISQSIYSHPYIPCFEKKTRVLNQAVNNDKLRAVREHGEGGENGDHVAYSRRHFWITDLKKFITENYPNDRPKTIFHNDELKPIVDLAEYERMNQEYNKLLSENTLLQAKLNEVKTDSASKDSKIRDQDLAMQSLAIQVQQAKTAQNDAEKAQKDAEERLEEGREYYRQLQKKYNQLKIKPDSKLTLDNALYLLGEVINAVKAKNRQWTQSAIIDEILTQRKEKQVIGLEQRTIEEYFSTANKRFKDK